MHGRVTYYQRDGITIRKGNCLRVMAGMAENSVDTVITDPPAGIAFMGKKWDNKTGYHPYTEKGTSVLAAFSPLLQPWESGFLAFIVDYAFLALRVAKPGAINLTWAIPRTSDLTQMGLRLAGWEIRDTIYHCFGSGFPKSHSLSVALDKMAGAEREIVGQVVRAGSGGGGDTVHQEGGDKSGVCDITAPATPAAKLWDGYGTALKPSIEEWIVAMKPLDGTFAANALEWGVAGLNIDGARVESASNDDGTNRARKTGASDTVGNFGFHKDGASAHNAPGDKGRWPANLILSYPNDADDADGNLLPNPEKDEVVGCFPYSKSGGGNKHPAKTSTFMASTNREAYAGTSAGGDEGSAARFFKHCPPDAKRVFYAAKAAKSERQMGLDGLDSVELVCYNETIPLNEREVSVWESTGLNQSIQAVEDTRQKRAIIVSVFGTLPPKVVDLCLLMYLSGRRPTGRFLKVLLSTTSMATNKTIASKICNLLHLWSISESIADVSCETVSGGNPAESVKNSSQSHKNTGISPKRDGPCMDDAESVTSELSAIRAKLEKLEQECARVPGHPTVKPLSLMRYLCTLTRTPTGGVVLDPFAGSGSTGVACVWTDRDFIGIEIDGDYCEISKRRIDAALDEPKQARLL